MNSPELRDQSIIFICQNETWYTCKCKYKYGRLLEKL